MAGGGVAYRGTPEHAPLVAQVITPPPFGDAPALAGGTRSSGPYIESPGMPCFVDGKMAASDENNKIIKLFLTILTQLIVKIVVEIPGFEADFKEFPDRCQIHAYIPGFHGGGSNSRKSPEIREL